MAATGFEDMWNPDCLYYDGEVGRIFHRKWHGLSFAHEVEYEQGEDPVGNFAPIAERMRSPDITWNNLIWQMHIDLTNWVVLHWMHATTMQLPGRDTLAELLVLTGLARMQIAFSLFGRVWPPEERFVIYCWRLRWDGSTWGQQNGLKSNKQPLQAENFQLIWFRSEILHLRSRMKERFPGLPVPSLKSDVIVSDEFLLELQGL